MRKVFVAVEGEKAAAVSAKIEQGPADRWRITMKRCERSGKLYAAGFGVISSQQR
ncbi:hypothetical protein [Pseudomonas sp. K5002]|uniref:hypothetical protein n=1 Tax=Pseudomonas sp. K5002 TaxID=2738828 RepID=UPI001804845A|nr:hypothetical protein [Pseudomonas sp. K5002]NWD85560.1 hypothetical protein [Pseudomonas sp. K5002]